MKFEWEIICKKSKHSEYIDCTLRAKVSGGWIVRHSGVSTYQSINNKFGYAAESSMVFIPDPEYVWEIETD